MITSPLLIIITHQMFERTIRRENRKSDKINSVRFRLCALKHKPFSFVLFFFRIVGKMKKNSSGTISLDIWVNLPIFKFKKFFKINLPREFRKKFTYSVLNFYRYVLTELHTDTSWSNEFYHKTDALSFSLLNCQLVLITSKSQSQSFQKRPIYSVIWDSQQFRILKWPLSAHDFTTSNFNFQNISIWCLS